MSISPMSSNVYNNMGYGAKAESPKKPAGAEPASVQPREEAPVASDTVELSAKKPADDTSATPALDTTTTTTTTPPQAGFPVVPVAVGGGVAGLTSAAIGYFGPWFEDENGTKLKEENGSFKSKDVAKYTVKDKTVTEVGDAKLAYEISSDGDNFKMGKITSTETVKGGYNFEKDGATSKLSRKLDSNGLGDLFAWHSPAAPTNGVASTTPTVPEYILEIFDGKGALKVGDAKLDFDIAGKEITVTTQKSATLTDEAIGKVTAALKTLNLDEAIGELKKIEPQKNLTEMLEGTKGKNWIAVGLAALGLGAVGAAAGFFFGKPKQVTAPDASTVS